MPAYASFQPRSDFHLFSSDGPPHPHWVRNLLALVIASFALVIAKPVGNRALVFNTDVHEHIVELPVDAKDRFGKGSHGNIPVTVFRPDGDGPFPLVIINHGRTTGREGRGKPLRVRFEFASRYFVRKGFAVAVPTRLGYGWTADAGDPEDHSDDCKNLDSGAMLEAQARQNEAIARRLQQEPWVDAGKTIVLGHSTGALAALAAGSRDIPGLALTIAIAGGRAGSPGSHPGAPCVPEELATHLTRLGREARAPSWWIYNENDMFFAPPAAQMWFDAYKAGGARASMTMLPSFGEDGHAWFVLANDQWQAMFDEELARHGFTQAGAIKRPPATDYAALDDVRSLPPLPAGGVEQYRKFLDMKTPRAFAVGPEGRYAAISGDDALSRSLALCRRERDSACRLYAVDDSVVW
ncbi:MAG: alpha/beta fold hydrolase [Moraxellaceae bacterium]|nr:alpha/beta fold hydrolase [Moraxellaceae bacterium]